MDDLTQEIREILRVGQFCIASLATVTQDGKPWVRYVSPVASDDLSLRFATHLNSRKVAQIRGNPEVHLTCGVTDPEKLTPYIQIQGRARLVTDSTERAAFWVSGFAAHFSGPDDPNYVVVHIEPYRIEVPSHTSAEVKVWEP
jgi:general stress protein 26